MFGWVWNLFSKSPDYSSEIKTCNAIIQTTLTVLKRGCANRRDTLYQVTIKNKKFGSWSQILDTVITANLSYLDWRRIKVKRREHFNKVENSILKNIEKDFNKVYQNKRLKTTYKIDTRQKLKFKLKEDKNSVDGWEYLNNETHPMRIAASAIANETGYCTEHAAVTYLQLRSKFDDTYRICFGRLGNFHWFCLLLPDPTVFPDLIKNGKSNNHQILTKKELDDNGDRIIVVDAWYPNNDACLWKNYWHKDQKYTVLTVKKGKASLNKPVNKLEHARVKFGLAISRQKERIEQSIRDKTRSILNKNKTKKLTKPQIKSYIENEKKKGNISLYFDWK